MTEKVILLLLLYAQKTADNPFEELSAVYL